MSEREYFDRCIAQRDKRIRDLEEEVAERRKPAESKQKIYWQINDFDTFFTIVFWSKPIISKNPDFHKTAAQNGMLSVMEQSYKSRRSAIRGLNRYASRYMPGIELVEVQEK